MPTFEIGPDRVGDVRTSRPYFLIPLLGLDSQINPSAHLDRVADFLRREPVTDIYVFSHGWHRNFFSAVAGYDRLISRFGVLSLRGRLTPQPTPFRPLFLAMHWNSDPGQDGWVDTAGRREKDSFLLRAAALFEPSSTSSEGAFLNFFEDLYEFMTYLSAPDVPALEGMLDGKAEELFTKLHALCDVRGELRDSPATGPEEKVALAWRCYDEADPQRVLLDQSEAPTPFANPLTAVTNLFKFSVAAVGLTALLGLLPKLLRWLFLLPKVQRLADAAGHWVRESSAAGPVLRAVLGLPWPGRVLAEIGLLTLTALAILLATALWQRVVRRGKGARGLPVLAVGSWLPLQLLFTLPALVYLFATYLFRTWIVLLTPLISVLAPQFGWGRLWPTVFFLMGCALYSFLAVRLGWPVGSLFNERLAQGKHATPPRVRDGLAWFARQPIRWFRWSVAPDSRALGLADALDKQLAFWEMQREAVRAGEEAGQFVEGLMKALGDAERPRVHLIGHSFGGLLMANAARYLAGTSYTIQSLTLLQAAMGSAWFATESWCRNGGFLRGALACIYSAYDMANGFYFPACNNGRMAAGYVGLYRAGKDVPQVLGRDGLFASLVQPPDLRPMLSGAPPFALNLDASRLIFAGNPAAGGGHEDVYKDDVIHMLWAITRLSSD